VPIVELDLSHSDAEDQGDGSSTEEIIVGYDSVHSEVDSDIQKLATDRQFSKPAKDQVKSMEKQADSEKRFKLD
jgi:hypothetical protein